jgi:hypothetical protein
MERQSIMKNKYLAGSNIDVFKNTHKLADININKALKKRSLLEDIQKTFATSKYFSNLTLFSDD